MIDKEFYIKTLLSELLHSRKQSGHLSLKKGR